MVLTPYYDRDGIKIYCGDCLDVLPKIEQGFAAAIVDLPYGVTASSWDRIISPCALWRQYRRLVFGAVALFCIDPFASALVSTNFDDFRYKWIWRKNGVTRFLNCANRPLLDYEEIAVFYAGRPIYNPQKWLGRKNHGRGKTVGDQGKSQLWNRHKVTPSDESGVKYPRLVLDFDKVPPSKIVHPAQKPVPLLSYLIRTYTNSGDVILDNAMGSGSTLVAAQHEGRRAVGIELNEADCKLAVGRLRQRSLFQIDSFAFAQV